MVKTKLNTIFISAVLLAVLLYSKIIPFPKRCLITLAPYDKIQFVTGTVVSNPAKISEEFYSMELKFHECISKDNRFFSASGTEKVLIPSHIVEAFFPDKLYSKNKNKICLLPVEQGINIKCSINNRQNSQLFIIDSVKELSYEKSVKGKFQSFRGLCRIQFKRLMKDWGKAGGFLLALLSGSREYLDLKLSNSFRLSGLSHILALSGMHLSLISSLAGIIENRSALKKLGLLFRVAVILVFVWFAGISPSLCRALISCLIAAFCTYMNIPETDGLTLLSTTFLIHTSIRPYDLNNLGFILSYCALAGIIILSRLILEKIARFIPGKAAGSISSSIGANIFTAPVSIGYFGVYSPGGIICTVFVSPVVMFFLYFGIFCMTLCFIFPGFLNICRYLMNFIYIIIVKIVEFWSIIPPLSLK